MDTKKFFIFLMMGLFMISMASAFDFDNKYNYDGSTETVTIHNCDLWVGWCLNEGEVLAELELVSGDTVVPAGIDILVGSFNVKFTSAQTKEVFDGLGIVDLKNGGTMTRGKQYKIKEITEGAEIPVYVDDCVAVEDAVQNYTNGTTSYHQECTQVFSHNTYEDVVEWKPISNPNTLFEAGVEYEVGIFVDVEAGDHGDWIPDLMGIKVDEWAEFQQSTAVDLQSYYRLDETTGNVLDEIMNDHGINVGGTRGASGRLGNAFSFDGTVGGITLSNSRITTDHSVAMWIYPTTQLNTFGYLFSHETSADSPEVRIFWTKSTGKISYVGYASGSYQYSIESNVTPSLNEWHFVTATYTQNDVKLYIDGVLAGDDTSATLTSMASPRYYEIGDYSRSPNNIFTGTIDEVGIWNRTLTQTEITELNNSGTGLQNPRNVFNWSAYNLGTGLVSYWKLDNLTDTFGSADLTNAGATYTASGKSGGAYDWDGSNDGMTSTDTSLNLEDAISFGGWVNFDSFAGSGVIIAKALGTIGENLYQIRVEASGVPTIISTRSAGTVYCSGAKALTLNNWHHVFGVSNSAGYTLYLDGEEACTVANTNGMKTGTRQKLTVGYDSPIIVGDRWYLDGTIDEIGIWATSFNQTQVQALFNYTSGNFYDEPEYFWVDAGLDESVASYYKLDEQDTTGTGTITDELGNNDGTNAGAVNTSGKLETAYTFTLDSIKATSGVQSDTTTSISAWFKTGSVATNIGRVACMNGGQASTGVCISFEDAQSGEMSILAEGIAWGSRSSKTYNDDQWHHGVATRNGDELILYVDGVVVSTFSATANFGTQTTIGDNEGSYPLVDGEIDEVGVWNTTLTHDQVWALYNYTSALVYGSEEIPSDPSPTITLTNSSANYTATGTYVFDVYASDNFGIENVSIYVDDVLNQTNTDGTNNTNYTFNIPLGDGDYLIKAGGFDNASQETITSAIRIVIDSTTPTVTTALNLTDQTTFTLPINSTWNYTATDTHIDSCYYNTSDNATQIVHTCNSSLITEWATEGNKTITYCANDTFGFETCNVDYAYIYLVSDEQGISTNETVEGLTVTWNLTVNLTATPVQSAYVVVNGSVYNATTTNASANSYFFELVKEIPDTWGNTTGNRLEWYWNYTIDGVVENQSTDTDNLTVWEMAIDDCSTFGDLILNFSLKDEELKTLVNGSDGANVEIDLTLASQTNSSITLDYSNTWTDDENPQVCLPNNVLNYSSYDIDFTVGLSSTDRVWEFYYLDEGTLNSTKIFDARTSQNINLMDLLTADSTSFLFNYFDQDGLAVEDAIIHVYRQYIGSGEFLEVERAKADQNGDTIVHLVEEDVIYYFQITQYGVVLYTTSQYTALCQTTPCTIQIEASGGSTSFPTDWDLVDGGGFEISASSSTREVQLSYTNNDSVTYNMSVYKYLSDGSYSLINTSSDTGTTGSFVMAVPQSAGNVSFFVAVDQDGEYLKSEWVDFTVKSSDYFGTTLSLFLAGIIILTLGLMAVSEGGVTLFWVILGIIISSAMGLITTDLSTGVNVVIYLILAGAILMWKLTGGRK